MLLNIIGNLEHGTFGQLPETQEICNIRKVDAAIVLTQCWFFLLILCNILLIKFTVSWDNLWYWKGTTSLVMSTTGIFSSNWGYRWSLDCPQVEGSPCMFTHNFFLLSRQTYTNNILDWFLSLYIALHDALLVLKSSLYVLLFGA